jgi:NADPH-dependent stearoyl-CoA 9-desaturase
VGRPSTGNPPTTFKHHKYTNILGMDDDVGYSTLRVTRDQPWKP